MDALGAQLAHELTAHQRLREFLGHHPTLIGAYAEASVHGFIERVVAPLRVSTGTIIYEGNYGQIPPQLDAIIWAPMVAPAIFESGNFAVIPRGNALAFLEVKASNYNGKVGATIEEKLSHAGDLIWPDLPVAFQPTAIGVVCVRLADRADPALDKLVAERRAVVLMEDRDGRFEPCPGGIWALVSFLLRVRHHARALDGKLGPLYPIRQAMTDKA